MRVDVYPVIPAAGPKWPKLLEVKQIVCEYYDITKAQLEGEVRTAWPVRARHVFCYLARRYTIASSRQIGQFLGGRDHSTVVHAFQKIELLLIDDQKMKDEVGELRARIFEKVSQRIGEKS